MTGAGKLGVVLAGGASTRMGTPKALVEIAGRPAAAHVLRAMRAAGIASVVIVTSGRGAPRDALAALGFDRVLVDEDGPVPGAQGPLCGIAAAAHLLAPEVALCWPVDTPLVPPAVLALMLQVPPPVRLEGNPLACVMDATTLARAVAAVRAGRTGVRDVLDAARVSTLESARVGEVDPDGYHARGFNDAGELAVVRSLAR